MNTAWYTIPLALAGAAIVGPYSGVSVENITDTPMIGQEALLQFTGSELLTHGTGMKLDEHDGEPVVVTQKGFSLSFEAELQSGMHIVVVEAMGTTRGNDSYYLAVNGRGTGGESKRYAAGAGRPARVVPQMKAPCLGWRNGVLYANCVHMNANRIQCRR